MHCLEHENSLAAHALERAQLELGVLEFALLVASRSDTEACRDFVGLCRALAEAK